MSARPRPVTATVNPPLTSTPLHGPRTFLSSDGSTESLISILDHESYESPFPSDNEIEPEPKTEPEKPKEETHVSRPQKPTGAIRRVQSAGPGPRKTCTLSDREKKQLTHWEEWLIQKTKDLRLQEEEKRREIEKKKEEELELKKEKAETDRKRAERAQEYLRKKEFKEKLRKNREKQRQISAQELTAAAKREVEEKAKQRVDEWRKQKADEEKKRKEKEKEEKEKKEKLEADLRAKSQEKVKSWFSEIKKRPRSAPRSYGYSEGKLTGYYDRSAYPEPAFYNPIPWQPIHVPNQGGEKKKRVKKPTKKRFNPNKYL